MKVLRCKKLGGREVPHSCHVLNGRKDNCKDLFVTDEKSIAIEITEENNPYKKKITYETRRKKLLLKDLCARLPYNPIVYVDESLRRLKLGVATRVWEYIAVDKPCKPYLRLMSNMVEEEKVQLSQYACIGEDLNGEFIDEVQRKDCSAYIDWLNAHHFDYRNLIEKGLAIEAPEGMYNIK